VFGAFDERGVEQPTELEIILAHELLGHAFFSNNGTEDPRDLSRRGRATHDGHDKSINVENKVRFEIAYGKNRMPDPFRGISRNPNRVVSVWKKKRPESDPWKTRAVTRRDILD
jgi:hypothetical protein